MFNDFKFDNFGAENTGSQTAMPEVVFFPFKPLGPFADSDMLARTLPKFLSMRLEQINKFKIFYVYFLNKGEISETQLSLPNELNQEKFISDYLKRLNIKYDVAIYGEISEGSGGSIALCIKAYCGADKKVSLVYENEFKREDLITHIGDITNKISFFADSEGECMLTNDHENLCFLETSSFEALYGYLKLLDFLTLRNPYKPLNDSAVEMAFKTLCYDGAFSYLIEAVALICDDYLRFDMRSRAIEICDRAIQTSGSHKFYLTKAKMLLGAGEYDEAFKTLRRCLEINSDIGDVAYHFGKLAMDMQKYEDARFAFNKMIEQNYNVSSAYDNLGVIMAGKDKIDDAINFWHKAIEFEPAKVSAYTNLARAYIELSDYEKADNYLQKAKLLNPSYFMVYLNYYVMYKKKGELEKASENYEKAMELNPDLAVTDEIRLGLKKMIELIDSDNELEAIEICGSLVSSNARCWQAYFLKGIAFRKLSRFDEAAEVFLKSAQINQKFPDSQNELGLIYLSKGMNDDALLLFNNAVELAPANSGFLCNLGLCYVEMKKYDDARAVFYRAKYLNPNDAKIEECIKYLNQKSSIPENKANDGLRGFFNKIVNLFKK